MHSLFRTLLLLQLLSSGQGLAANAFKITADPLPSHQQFATQFKQSLFSGKKGQQIEQLQITIGPRSFKEVLQQRDDTPILALLLTAEELHTLRPLPPHRTITILFREQPLQRLINLTQITSPSLLQAGLLTTSSEPLSFTHTRPAILQQATSNLRSGLKHLLPKVDALITYHNPTLFTPDSFRNILLSAYRQQKPLICHTEAMVKAGCVVGVHSSVADLINEAIEWIDQYPNSRHSKQRVETQYSSHFTVSTNPKVAQSLGIRLPHPSHLREQLLQLEVGP